MDYFISNWVDYRNIANQENTLPLAGGDFFSEHQTIMLLPQRLQSSHFEYRHDFFKIQIILQGQVSQAIEHYYFSLVPGDICFIPPDTTHSYDITDTDTLLLNILLDSNSLQSTFTNSLKSDDVIASFFTRSLLGKPHLPYLLWHSVQSPSIQKLLTDMLDCQSNPTPYTNRLLITMLEQLFIFLLKDHANDLIIENIQKKKDENIISILQYAHANYATITLTELAKHFNYSEAYLSRTLKSYLGCSFSKYFIDIRLNKAAQLLMTTATPITAILLQVGYTDKTHFYRSFHKKFGMTPNEYRKQRGES